MEGATMGFPVYDYRQDIRNILVTPQIRARFLRMELGQVNRGHTHDLGHEIFLILQGRAEFEIDGEKEVLGPGQMCVALVDQNHIVRNVGDEPVIMYLSVTPHIQPTHTMWTEEGNREPPRFSPSTAYDVPLDESTPTEALLQRHLAAAEALSEKVKAAATVQREQAALLTQALSAGERAAALEARDKMWAALATMFSQSFELAQAWNDLTSRLAASDSQ
jgi:quercetin dioxygenase-like cupin family protein